MDRVRSLIRSQNDPIGESGFGIFEAICCDCAENLDADLTSVWVFDSTFSQIRSIRHYDAISEKFSSGHILSKTDFPNYFSCILEEHTVSAPNCREHPVTKEFTESYFKPNGIVSLLDYILQKDHEPIGIICCENRRDQRNWSEENTRYLRSIAALTSIAFMSHASYQL